jgi:CRP/FNR family transcriptional regulator
MANYLESEAGAVGSPQGREPEDLLAWLPCSVVTQFNRGEQIFNYQHAPAGLYLVIQGKVRVFSLATDGTPVLVDVYQPEDFFGESAFLRQPRAPQAAVAMDDVQVMSWAIGEVEDLIARRPKLALGLIQLLVRRSNGFADRIESFCADNIPQRLARALVRFSDRFAPSDAGVGLQMVPLTHELLAQYVGTSREIVTQYMNRFRREGLLRYSRASIVVDRIATTAWLAANSGGLSSAPAPVRAMSASA